MLNRRLLMAQAGETPPGGGIVTDGLQVYLDGTNMGDDPNTWIDTIGGNVFTLINCQKQEKGILLMDKSSCAENSSVKFPLSGTIEICYVPNEPKRFAMASKNNFTEDPVFILGPYGDQMLCGNNVKSKFPGYKIGKLIPKAPILFSANRIVAMYNTKQLQPGAPNYWTLNEAQTKIGRVGDRPGVLGYVYSFRYYNRMLSAEEMLQNQQHDIDTYFGGVIPE